MSMIPMPEFFEAWLQSLSPEESSQMMRWVQYGTSTESEIEDAIIRPNGTFKGLQVFRRYQDDFWEARSHQSLIARCIELARCENLPIQFAWVTAAMLLLEQNRQLLEDVTALMKTQPLSATYSWRTATGFRLDDAVFPFITRITKESGLLETDEELRERMRVFLNEEPKP